MKNKLITMEDFAVLDKKTEYLKCLDDIESLEEWIENTEATLLKFKENKKLAERKKLRIQKECVKLVKKLPSNSPVHNMLNKELGGTK